MLIKFPPKILDEKNEDRLFLASLDKRLHYVKDFWSVVGVGIKTGPEHCYHGEKMTSCEIERVLGLIGEPTGLAMTPESATIGGFKVGYRIIYSEGGQRDPLLMFLQEQLPESYDFARLSETFLRGDNIDRLVKSGFDRPSKCEGEYRY